MSAVFHILAQAAGNAGEIDSAGLLDKLSRTFRAVTSASEVVMALQIVCFALITWGLVTALIRANGPPEVLSALAKGIVIVGFVALTSTPAERDRIPDISEALANAVSGSGDWKAPAKKVVHLAKLMFPGEDLPSVDTQKVTGASQAGFFQFSKRIAEGVMSALLVWLRVILALVVTVIAFVALYIGWFVGELIVWFATILYELGWMLVPVAVAALSLEGGKGIGQSYLLGMVAVGMSRFAIALAGLGTTAIMKWLTDLFQTLTSVNLSSILDSPPSDTLRQDFAGAFILLPIGAWALILIGCILLAAWAIFTPLMAWKVFMQTLQRGSQFGATLGMAFAGGVLAAAGNGLQMAGRVAAAGEGASSSGRGGGVSQSVPPDGGGGGGVPPPQPPGGRNPAGGDRSLAMSEQARQRALAAVGGAVMQANARGATPEEAHAAGVRAGMDAGAPAGVAHQMAGLANFVMNGTNTASSPGGSGDGPGPGGPGGGGGGGGGAGGGRSSSRASRGLALPVALGTAGAVLSRLAQHVASDSQLPPASRGILEEGYEMARSTRAQSDQRLAVRTDQEAVDIAREQLAELRRLATNRGLA